MSAPIETRPYSCNDDPFHHVPEWITTEALARGFRDFTLGLGDFNDYQEQLDEVLDNQTKTIDPELGNHARRVGGYTGAIVRATGGAEFADDFHVGLARISGASHDIGKQFTDRIVLFRSLGRTGFGEFIRARDMPHMYPHPTQGYELIEEKELYLPPEAKVAAGCHHLITAPGQLPYGVPWAEASQRFQEDPAMMKWLAFVVRATNMADYFDAATSRTNSYFDSGNSRNTCIQERAAMLYKEQAGAVIHALVSEQAHYVLQPEVISPRAA